MYQPTDNLLEGIRNCFPMPLFPWDQYFPEMARADFEAGFANVPAVKSYFVRQAPSGAPFTLLGGLTEGLRTINDLRFDSLHFQQGMRDMGFGEKFCDYLARCQRLNVKILAPWEGTPFFPNEPIVTVIGPLPHVRLAEGILIEAMNFPSLSLSKWNRLARTVFPANAVDFSRRRDQYANRASFYSILAGCWATSNAEMRRFFSFLIIGTMGHEWVQGFGNVREAFACWLRYRPDKPVALVDTLRCMAHDFPIWLEEVYRNRERIKEANPPAWGWRNDSGDLADLAVRQFKIFLEHPLAQDPWFRERVRIFMTDEIDEYKASDIMEKIREMVGMPIALDIFQVLVWAAGTRPGVCHDEPAIKGVMKLMEVNNHACIKLALDEKGQAGGKTSVPGFNRSALVFDREHQLQGVLIYPAHRYCIYKGPFGHGLYDTRSGERVPDLAGRNLNDPWGKGLGIPNTKYYLIPQQAEIYNTGEGGFTRYWENPTIESVQTHIFERLARLPDWAKRIKNAAPVPVFLTPDLAELRNNMIRFGVLREDYLRKE